MSLFRSDRFSIKDDPRQPRLPTPLAKGEFHRGEVGYD